MGSLPTGDCAALSRRSRLRGPPYCVRCAPEWSLLAVAPMQPSTRPLERGPAGTVASWSFLFHTLLTVPSPWATCSRGWSPELELHWENQVHSKCSIFIFWLGRSWSPRDRSDTYKIQMWKDLCKVPHVLLHTFNFKSSSSGV